MKIPIMREDAIDDCSLLDVGEVGHKTKGNQISLVLLITKQHIF